MEKCLHCLPVEMVTMLKSFITAALNEQAPRSQRMCYNNFGRLVFVYLQCLYLYLLITHLHEVINFVNVNDFLWRELCFVPIRKA